MSEDLVRRLLRAQHPDLAHLAVAHQDGGWDNELFRVGDALAARLPRRKAAEPLIRLEQTWLPGLARELPLPVPAPVRAGAPGEGYPFAWSLAPWIDGAPADLARPGPAAAGEWAGFLAALGRPAAPDIPHNPFRSIPLAARAEGFDALLARTAADPAAPLARALAPEFAAAAAQPYLGAPVRLHGDLHARNVLVADGRIRGVIDWGDFCRGDPATDFASLWILFSDAGVRRAAFEAARGRAGLGEADWRRARAWALLFALLYLAAGGDSPMIAIGRATLAALAEGP